MNCVLNSITMQTWPIHLFRCSRKIPHLPISVFSKDRCTSKTIPEWIIKKSFKIPFILRRDSPMAFINYERYPCAMYLFITFGIDFIVELLYKNTQLLYRCYDNLLFIFLKSLWQHICTASLIDVNDIVVRVGFKSSSRLRIKSLTIYKEYGFLYTWNFL